MRLVTRGDLDGLTCAVLITSCEDVSEDVAVAVGHSIFNRTCRTNIGLLMSGYGGGGHRGAGTCLIPEGRAEAVITEIGAALKKDV